MASRLLYRSVAAGRPAATVVNHNSVVASRYLSSTTALGHKESSSHPDHEQDPEKHKQDLLAKQKDGKGHWKPELASDSEEAVKADRAGAQDINNLQERTKAVAEETSKHGTSMRDGL